MHDQIRSDRNFVRIHKTLRTTPAMAAKVTDGSVGDVAMKLTSPQLIIILIGMALIFAGALIMAFDRLALGAFAVFVGGGLQTVVFVRAATRAGRKSQ